jgi:hypothetical protein
MSASQPAVFSLFGIAGVLFIHSCLKRNWDNAAIFVVITLFWIINFEFVYFLNIHIGISIDDVQDYWQNAGRFPPSALSAAFPGWLIQTLNDFLTFDLAASPGVFAVYVLLVSGLIGLFRTAPLRGWLLVTPFLLTLLATFARDYVFAQRVVLFLVPLAILISAFGAEYLFKLATRTPDVPVYTLLFGIVVTMLINPLQDLYLMIITHSQLEEVKPVLSFFSRHRQAGDGLYLYYASQYAYRFYAPEYNLSDQKYIVGGYSPGQPGASLRLGLSSTEGK